MVIAPEKQSECWPIMIIPVLLPWIFRSITYHALRETQGLTLLEFLWIISMGLQTCSVNYMYLVHQLVTTMAYLQTAHLVHKTQTSTVNHIWPSLQWLILVKWNQCFSVTTAGHPHPTIHLMLSLSLLSFKICYL